ncbi:hypothetical protein BH11PSE4_BH11PSE4_12010 [soil metagenome]
MTNHSRIRSIPFAMALATGLSYSAAMAQNEASAGASAATGKVIGPNSEPQVGVPVVVQGPAGTTQAFTDAKGNWSLYNLQPGDYQVKPAVGANSNASVSFSVKERGLVNRWLGSEPKEITTSVMKLDKDFKTH